jgi:hypothetical protein
MMTLTKADGVWAGSNLWTRIGYPVPMAVLCLSLVLTAVLVLALGRAMRRWRG